MTKQGLDFHGFHPINGDSFATEMEQPDAVSKLAIQGMASACSVAEIDIEGKTQLIGNSVDVKMFEATKWRQKNRF